MQRINDRLYNWASSLESQARDQAMRTARLSIVNGHVALMPDAHWGMGSTVGSVIPTKGAIIPAAVGVDIGCGMIAVKTTLGAEHLPDSFDGYRDQAARDIPAGVGQGHGKITEQYADWLISHPAPTVFSEKQSMRAGSQLGSLGSGNHFFEVCLDEDDRVWLVLHSGSRGIGNELAQIHIGKARRLFEDSGAVIEDKDLAWLAQGTTEFDAYIADMLWAQSYAYENRQQMMNAALRGFFLFVGFGEAKETINCHHNYTNFEDDLWITRKGAISAREGEMGVIPGSMGTCSYIVRGKGNPLSHFSSSHGAGRVMSRGQARREIKLDDFRAVMSHTAWQDSDAQYLVDEAPQAYKDINQVMADQTDLTEAVHELRQVFNYKGVERSSKRASSSDDGHAH